jgi:transcriptional regulator with XRE-family HTH domain
VESPSVLPEQEDLQRRLAAARALRGLTVKELASLCPPEAKLSEKTLYKLEGGDTILTLPILRELAYRLSVPIEWFTVADLPRSVAPIADADRVAALEAEMARVWKAMRSGPESAIRPRPPGGH